MCNPKVNPKSLAIPGLLRHGGYSTGILNTLKQYLVFYVDENLEKMRGTYDNNSLQVKFMNSQ